VRGVDERRVTSPGLFLRERVLNLKQERTPYLPSREIRFPFKQVSNLEKKTSWRIRRGSI